MTILGLTNSVTKSTEVYWAVFFVSKSLTAILDYTVTFASFTRCKRDPLYIGPNENVSRYVGFMCYTRSSFKRVINKPEMD